MNIGMVCYASVGGSGVVATELAHALAGRGHTVHLISSEPPFRWRAGVQRLSFVQVEVPPYPLFREPQYLLALTTTIARVAEERAARYRARALRRAARDGGVPRRTHVDVRPRRRPTTDGDDAARHGYHARRQRPVVREGGGVLNRAVARGDGRLAQPEGRHRLVPRHPPRHRGDPELPRLLGVSAAA